MYNGCLSVISFTQFIHELHQIWIYPTFKNYSDAILEFSTEIVLLVRFFWL